MERMIIAVIILSCLIGCKAETEFPDSIIQLHDQEGLNGELVTTFMKMADVFKACDYSYTAGILTLLAHGLDKSDKEEKVEEMVIYLAPYIRKEVAIIQKESLYPEDRTW